MDIQIEPAAQDSVTDIIRLMRDFAAYEDLVDYCTVTEDALHDAMFGPDAIVSGIVARDHNEIVAYALFYRCFASFRGQRGYYLEDLYIDERYRGRGLGKRMLMAVAATARADGAERLDFQVLDWNVTAIQFYRSHGAVSAAGESHFKFAEEAFARLANA